MEKADHMKICSASVTTVVKFNNFLGRVYFIGIWVFHKLLVKSLFRKAIKSKKLRKTRVTRVMHKR